MFNQFTRISQAQINLTTRPPAFDVILLTRDVCTAIEQIQIVIEARNNNKNLPRYDTTHICSQGNPK